MATDDTTKSPPHLGTALLTHRCAGTADLDAIRALMDTAIAELQKPYLDAAQIASSRLLMGLDTQLIADQTYYVIKIDGSIAGCGGWSRRATLYGGDGTPGRSPALLDPRTDAARIRAMYTHPAHVRKGVGRLILDVCERDAKSRGLHARGTRCHSVRRTALHRRRLCCDRALRGWSRRCSGAAGADGESALRRIPFPSFEFSSQIR